MDKVCSMENLKQAWEKISGNMRVKDRENREFKAFEASLSANLERLARQLASETYRPHPVRQIRIPKTGKPGEHRALGIPTLYDKLCQHALLNCLEPAFEPQFEEASFGYRRGRSTRDAVDKVCCDITQGYNWIIKADLKDFFGSIHRELLMTLLSNHIEDQQILRLIRRILNAGYLASGKRYLAKGGIPQGCVTSPFFGNVLLTPFDREMRQSGYRLVRYADDWIMLFLSRSDANQGLIRAIAVLDTLHVKINPAKTSILCASSGFDFLGYTIKQKKRAWSFFGLGSRSHNDICVSVCPSAEAVQKFKKRLHKIITQDLVEDLPGLVERLNPVIRGWGNYYRTTATRSILDGIDQWILREIHSFRCKHTGKEAMASFSPPVVYDQIGLVRLSALATA